LRILAWSFLLAAILGGFPLHGESILDFADTVVEEAEENDTTPQDLSGEFIGNIQAVGVPGELSSETDVDRYKTALASGGKMQLKFQPLGGGGASITSLTAGEGNLAYFIADHHVWRQSGAIEPSGKAELLISAEQIAAVLGVAAEAVELTDLAYPPAGGILLLAERGSQSILSWAEMTTPENNPLQIAVSKSAILAATGKASANLIALATDATGAVYAADQVSGGVLKISSDFSTVQVYTAGSLLAEAFETQVREDLTSGEVVLPTTALAKTTGLFMANAVVAGTGAYDGYFYVTQLSKDNNGTGGITKITVNEEDPNAALFEAFFDPDASQDNLDPSALALDTSAGGVFGNKMYMGTFGASMGDDFDGTVYQVSESGEITPFITSFVNADGNPATFGDKVVTGFFDVTDLAFSSGGAFGNYLYVISENIDSNGTEAGGYQSDIWRVDPNGKAELFVPNIADGAISLAFGNFLFNGDLFVGTFSYGNGSGVIYRVDSTGNVSTFFDFNQFSSSLSVCDMTFSPEDSEFGGDLVITLKSGGSAFLVSFSPDGSYQTWASGLATGDVSSGDVVFDASGNLVIAMASSKSLVRMDYQGVFDYQMEGLENRPVTTTNEDETETTEHVPYALLKGMDTFWLFKLIETEEASDITAELGPSELNNAMATEEDPREVTYAFDDAGEMYLYVQNQETLRKVSQDDLGNLGAMTTVLPQSQIDQAAGLTDARPYSLAWGPDGRLLGIGRNGTAAEGEEEPDTTMDDRVLMLGNTAEEAWEPETLVGAADLSQMRLTVSGPDSFERNYLAAAGEILDQTLESLAAGEDVFTIQSRQNGAGEYEFLVNLGGELEGTLAADAANSPIYFTDTKGQALALSCTGGGRAELQVTRKPSGVVISMGSLTLFETDSKTEVFLGPKSLYETNDDSLESAALADLTVENITLDGSLKSLVYPGTVTVLRATADSKGTIRNCVFGDIQSVNAEAYSFGAFSAITLGHSTATGLAFAAKGLDVLEVKEDLRNVRFFTTLSRNRYDSIRVGGVLADCVFYGTSCDRLEVNNSENAANAVDGCSFNLSGTNSFLHTVRIAQGTVADTSFYAGGSLQRFEIQNGNLDSSDLVLTDERGTIREILIYGDSDEGRGTIESSYISCHQIDRIVTDGAISSGTQIRAYNSYSSKLESLCCGGDFDGTVFAMRVGDIRVGFDRDGNRKPESDDYAGSDLTGSVTGSRCLDTVSVTGKIDTANLSCSGGNIRNIFVEDGLLDSTVSAGRTIQRILVGYIGEKRKAEWLANPQADVSGTISARLLGRLYYTGTLDPDTNLPARRGPVRDDVK